MAGWFPLAIAAGGGSSSARILRIGAAGFVRGLDIASDDSVLNYTDTYGAYIWEPATASLGNAGGLGNWRQLVSTSTIPTSDPGMLIANVNAYGSRHGVYEARFCKSDSNKIWMACFGYIYKSTNKGVGFTPVTTPFTPAAAADMNSNPDASNTRAGPKMAVDPINSSVVYFGLLGTRPWYTFNGGTSWAQIGSGSMAAPSTDWHTAIAIDPRVSTQSGGVSTRGFFGVSGTGIYISTNLGSGTPTYTKISGSGTSNTALTTIYSMFVDSQGNLWVTDYTGAQNNLWRYSPAGVWTQPDFAGQSISSGYMRSFAEDRTVANGARVIGFTDQMLGMLSNNAQAATPTWSGGFFPDASVGTRVATDCPALAYMTPEPLVGELQIDSTGKAWVATGIGIFTATIPSTFATGYNWTSRNSGIEGLSTNMIAHSTSGNAIPASADRGFYVSNLSTYPLTVFPQDFSTFPGMMCVDWATSDPNTFAGMYFENCAIWNGSSWSVQVLPVTPGGGRSCIACASPTNFVVMPTNSKPHYTTNGGVGWTNLATYFSVNHSVTADVNLNNREQVVCADRVAANTFYMRYAGFIWRSTNSGAAWTPMSTDGVAGGLPSMVGGNAMLRSVNGKQGHLLYCGGQTYQGSWPFTATTNLVMSTDGGANWSDIATIRDVWGIDTGPQVGSYPRMWAWGYANSQFGYHYSDNQGVAWTTVLTQYFNGSYDSVNWIEAHKTDATKFLVAFEGSGYGLYG